MVFDGLFLLNKGGPAAFHAVFGDTVEGAHAAVLAHRQVIATFARVSAYEANIAAPLHSGRVCGVIFVALDGVVPQLAGALRVTFLMALPFAGRGCCDR